MSDDLVTVYSAMDEPDAEVIKVVLEAEGIDCIIANAGQGGLSGVIPAHVQVRSEDAERAKAFIAEHENRGDSTDDT